MSQDWRIETDSQAYLLHQRKRLDIDQRRPVIRTASDLVGPGIGSEATPITDFNDQLATFNGYYSAAPGALYAPNATDSFIGFTVMDATLGGKQVFTSLVSGNEYTRVFRRSPSDSASIAFGAWQSGGETPAVAYGTTKNPVDSQGSISIVLAETRWCQLPQMKFSGLADTFNRTNSTLAILRPGVYTGHLVVRTVENVYLDHLIVEFPWEDEITTDHLYVIPSTAGIPIPLNFISTGSAGFIRVSAVLGNDGMNTSAHVEVTRLHVTRVGDV